MPIYDYVCDNGHRFEVIHGITATGPGECPVCGSTQVRKGFVAPTIVFKGSGWAKKDRSAAKRAASSTDGKESGDTGAKEAEPSTSTVAAATDGGAGKSVDGAAAGESSTSKSAPRSDANASSGVRPERTGPHEPNRRSKTSESTVEGG